MYTTHRQYLDSLSLWVLSVMIFVMGLKVKTQECFLFLVLEILPTSEELWKTSLQNLRAFTDLDVCSYLIKQNLRTVYLSCNLCLLFFFFLKKNSWLRTQDTHCRFIWSFVQLFTYILMLVLFKYIFLLNSSMSSLGHIPFNILITFWGYKL